MGYRLRHFAVISALTMRKPDELFCRKIGRKQVQWYLKYNCKIRFRCMNGMYLVAVYNDKFSGLQAVILII